MDQLEKGLGALELKPSEKQLRQLNIYISELLLWNSRFSLIRASSREEIVPHILDSLSLVPVIRTLPGKSVADLGSGNGTPGIPAAVFLEDYHVSLVERSEKKCGFLRNAVSLTGLEHVTVTAVSLEEVRSIFPVTICRAFGNLTELFPHIMACTEPGGTALFCKGRRETVEDELSRLNPDDSLYTWSVIPACVPDLAAERNILIVQKKFDRSCNNK